MARPNLLPNFTGVSLAEMAASNAFYRKCASAKQLEAEARIDEIWAAAEKDRAELAKKRVYR
jgi:hypothetical protein